MASFELLPLFRTMTRGRKGERERKNEIQAEVKRVTLQNPPLCGGNCFLLSNGRKRKFQPRHSPSKRDALPFFTPLQPIQHLLFNYSTNKQTSKQQRFNLHSVKLRNYLVDTFYIRIHIPETSSFGVSRESSWEDRKRRGSKHPKTIRKSGRRAISSGGRESNYPARSVHEMVDVELFATGKGRKKGRKGRESGREWSMRGETTSCNPLSHEK